MRQINPYLLWVGHAGDGRDFRAILNAGVRAVVQVAAEEPTLQLPRDLIYCRVPLVDGPGNDAKQLSLAIAAVAKLLEIRVPTLVCCGAGLSRSPAIAAAALARMLCDKPDACLARVTQEAPADVAPGLWHEVKLAAAG